MTAEPSVSPADTPAPSESDLMQDEVKLPCGCYAVQRGKYRVITAEAFLCNVGHRLYEGAPDA